jgi:hypothetical protein
MLEVKMSQKQVVVNEDNTRMTINIGQDYRILKAISVDLTDSKSIVEGVTEALSLGQALANERLNALAQKIESLEKLILSADDVRRITHLLRTQSGEFRADGKPTNDELLASKLEATMKT